MGVASERVVHKRMSRQRVVHGRAARERLARERGAHKRAPNQRDQGGRQRVSHERVASRASAGTVGLDAGLLIGVMNPRGNANISAQRTIRLKKLRALAWWPWNSSAKSKGPLEANLWMHELTM